MNIDSSSKKSQHIASVINGRHNSCTSSFDGENCYRDKIKQLPRHKARINSVVENTDVVSVHKLEYKKQSEA